MATTEKCPKCGEQISTAAPLSHHCGAVAVPSQVANLCTWEADDDGIWHAACDHTSQHLYCFDVGGPDTNGFSFCPFCGRHLLEVKPLPAPIEEDGPEGDGFRYA